MPTQKSTQNNTIDANPKNESIPKCIGVIMDGNRRWAKQNHLPSLEGHRRGYAKLKEFVAWAKEAKVEAVIAFALSTENWKRSSEEVGYLMDLFRMALNNEIASLRRDNVRLQFVGQKNDFPEDIQKLMKDAEEETKGFKGPILAIAASYGGRAEIINTVKTIVQNNDGRRVQGNGDEEQITEKEFNDLLWTKNLPEPDIILRTGGEKRLSGFLPWQSVYSELFFSDTLWPDYSETEFMAMLKEFAQRQRNFGK